jgi:hypothetical protein
LVGLTGLVRRQDIVAVAAQLLDDAKIEVLVGVELGHWAQASSFSWMSRSISSACWR